MLKKGVVVDAEKRIILSLSKIQGGYGVDNGNYNSIGGIFIAIYTIDSLDFSYFLKKRITVESTAVSRVSVFIKVCYMGPAVKPRGFGGGGGVYAPRSAPRGFGGGALGPAVCAAGEFGDFLAAASLQLILRRPWWLRMCSGIEHSYSTRGRR